MALQSLPAEKSTFSPFSIPDSTLTRVHVISTEKLIVPAKPSYGSDPSSAPFKHQFTQPSTLSQSAYAEIPSFQLRSSKSHRTLQKLGPRDIETETDSSQARRTGMLHWKVAGPRQTRESNKAVRAAAACGNMAALQPLLIQGANVDAVSRSWRHSDGMTPLMLAASFGFDEAVKCLLSYGADVHASDDRGETALHKACSNGHIDTARLLMDSKADFCKRDKNNHMPLHKSIINGGGTIMSFILRHYDLRQLPANEGTALLHVAVQQGSYVIVKELLKTTLVDPNHQMDITKAAFSLPASLKTKAKPPLMRAPTPLIRAVALGSADVVETLIAAGADVDIRVDGISPLGMACAKDCKDVLIILLRNNPTIENCWLGHDALWTAAQFGHLDVFRIIWLYTMQAGHPHDGESIDQEDWDYMACHAALVMALEGNHLRLLQSLLAFAAVLPSDKCSLSSDEESTVASDYLVSTLKLLLVKDCDSSVLFFHPIIRPIAGCYRDFIYKLIDLIHFNSRTTKLTRCCPGGPTLLYLAAATNDTHMVERLLEKGIDTDTLVHGETAIVVAARYGHLEVVRLLLSKGADPIPMGCRCLPREKGCTECSPNGRFRCCLKRALLQDDPKTALRLLAHHTDPRTTDLQLDYFGALFLAIAQGSAHIVREILCSTQWKITPKISTALLEIVVAAGCRNSARGSDWFWVPSSFVILLDISDALIRANATLSPACATELRNTVGWISIPSCFESVSKALQR